MPDVPLPPALSADCRSVAFASGGDVFVYDRRTRGEVLASLATSGTRADKASAMVSLSHDGRTLAFDSFATNLVPPRSPPHANVYVRDLAAGVTLRASRARNGGLVDGSSTMPVLSGDGRVVAFLSGASRLVAGDRNGRSDVFAHDLAARRTERLSVSSDGAEANAASGPPAIDRDGRVVVFASEASNLVADDRNGTWDVFVRDRRRGRTRRVSVAPGGRDPDGASDHPVVDARGRLVAFASDASNLVPGDRNGARDVFVADRRSGTITRASVAKGGAEGNADSDLPDLSADGRLVAFVSRASNLVAGDRNGVGDVFVRDLRTGTTRRVGEPYDGSDADDESGSMGPRLAADGSCVLFDSFASNLVADDPNRREDLFLVELGER